MNKKILGALSLPLLVAACSSEDLMTTPQGENGQYDVAKVDVTLALDDAQTRLATGWDSNLEAGKDELGFAWLGDGSAVAVNGKAYQNHPLFTQEGGYLKPATSIYVGRYYSYYPYNDDVVSVRKIPFTLEGQPFAEGDAGYNGAAKHSIWISPKWTNVTLAGDPYTENNKAGRDNKITISPRQFTNKALLQLKYKNADIAEGNTSINSVSVALVNPNTGDVISPKEFIYAPTTSTDAADWTGYALASGVTALTPGAGGIPMSAPAQVNGVSATPGRLELTVNGYEILPSKEGAVENFTFNALPALEVVQPKTEVEVIMNTTYGVLTISEQITDVAYTLLPGKSYAEKADGVRDAENKLLGAVDLDRSFVQVLGSTGKFVLEADFSKAVMNGMCVTDDTHLQKLLNYYKNKKQGKEAAISEEKEGTDIVLNLNATASEFRLSQTSIALIKEINGTTGDKLVSIQPCSAHGTPAIVITGGGEVPNLDRVFETSIVNVTLANETWTWNSTDKKLSDMVNTLTNNGTLNIASTNVESGYAGLINNNVINFTAGVKTNIKTDLINNVDKQINVVANSQMLSYNNTIVNKGNIDNDGVIGVVKDTYGEINNYGYIHNDADAKTYITNNQTSGASFSILKNDPSNLIGTIELTNWNDNISVSNNTNQGFIKYAWTGEGTYVTPTPAVDVKYNYLIISKNIEFTESEKEISYLEVKSGAGEVVITAESANNVFESPNRLKGFILPEGAKANIKLKNTVKAAAAYIKGELYVGGVFAYDQLSSYLGGESTDTDNIVEY